MARGDRFPGTRPTMPAVDLHGRDGFALLARAFVELGAKEHLPALPAAGARDVASALAAASALVQAGVPAEVLVNLATWYRDHAGGSGSSTDGPGSVALVISSTPARPAASGEATVPQPATAGHLAVATVPRDSGPPPDPVPANPGRRGDLPVRREVRRACKRSALEAALAEHRRDALADLDENVLARSSQAPLQSRVRTWVDLCQAWAVEPWPISLEAIRNVAASLRRGGYRSAQNYFDAAVAYQERFREQAVDPRTVTLRVPLHKSATGGQTELTMRQLRCACRAAVAPLCPYHAAVRHTDRLKAAGLWFRDRPLFPDSTGDTWEKSSAILLFRRVLVAAGIQTTSIDHTGAPIQLFGGHLARVAGASWLASKGVPTPIIQLLGRWSSAAVERYIQAAPLAMAPGVPQRVLHQPTGSPPPALEFGSVVAQASAAPGRAHARPGGPDGRDGDGVHLQRQGAESACGGPGRGLVRQVPLEDQGAFGPFTASPISRRMRRGGCDACPSFGTGRRPARPLKRRSHRLRLAPPRQIRRSRRTERSGRGKDHGPCVAGSQPESRPARRLALCLCSARPAFPPRRCCHGFGGVGLLGHGGIPDAGGVG